MACCELFWSSAHELSAVRTRRNQSDKLIKVNSRVLFRFVLPALISVPLGFFLLALAAQNEPNIPGPLVILFSPGLKLAELLTPHTHESLGATFGWFLRIAIAVNAAYYFVLFFLLASLLGPSRQSTVESRKQTKRRVSPRRTQRAQRLEQPSTLRLNRGHGDLCD